MDRPQLSVVTPFRNAPLCLDLTLAGLGAQTLDRELWEVVIVDDASDVPVRPIVDAAPGGIASRLITLPERRGPGGARNVGAEAARGDILVFIDSDVVAAPDLLALHLAAHGSAGDDRVVLGHRYEASRETIQRVARGDTTPPDSPLEADLRDRWLDGDPAQSRAPWLWAYSHNVSLARSLFLRVGGFDEDFTGWGHEDVELGYRLFLHFGRTPEPFRYSREAYGFHVPHYVNAANKDASGQQNLRHFRRKHGRYDVELYGDQSPRSVGMKVARYEHAIASLLARGGGAVPPGLAVDGDLLVVGAGLDALDARAGRTVRYDHARPCAETDGHLLGVATPHGDDEFDTVVNVDLWRVLTTHDLNRMVGEALRLAPRLLLVQTETDDDIGYLARILEHRFHVRLATVAGGTVLEVPRPSQ